MWSLPRHPPPSPPLVGGLLPPSPRSVEGHSSHVVAPRKVTRDINPTSVLGAVGQKLIGSLWSKFTGLFLRKCLKMSHGSGAASLARSDYLKFSTNFLWIAYVETVMRAVHCDVNRTPQQCRVLNCPGILSPLYQNIYFLAMLPILSSCEEILSRVALWNSLTRVAC